MKRFVLFMVLVFFGICFSGTTSVYQVKTVKGDILFETTDSIRLEIVPMQPKIIKVPLDSMDGIHKVLTAKLKDVPCTYESYKITWTFADSGIISLTKSPTSKTALIIVNRQGSTKLYNHFPKLK